MVTPPAGRWQECPPSLFLFIETAEKKDVSFKMAKLGQRNRASRTIDHTSIELTHDIDQACRSHIDVPPAHVSRVRKECGLGQTVPGTFHCQSEVVSGKKRVSRHSRDRQTHLDRR